MASNLMPPALRAQATKLVLVTQHRVDGEVVCRVIAMVARCLEDGIEIEHRHAKGLEIVEMLDDALERTAIEVPFGDATIVRALVGGRRAPVLDKRASRTLARRVQRGGGALAPIATTGKAVWEDLVDNPVSIPHD